MTAPARGAILLKVLEQHAENGWVCPSLPQLAKLTGLTLSTTSDYLRRLRQAGTVTSRLVHVKPYGQARVVIIVASGKSTGKPQPSKRYNAPEQPAFTPTAESFTSIGRYLEGDEFNARAAELMAREAEQRRRREA